MKEKEKNKNKTEKIVGRVRCGEETDKIMRKHIDKRVTELKHYFVEK